MNAQQIAIISYLTTLLLLSSTIIYETSSLSISINVDNVIYVSMWLKNINPEVFTKLIEQRNLDESTIPRIIIENYHSMGMNRVLFYGERMESDSASRSIHISFYLAGSDVVSFKLNKEMTQKIYQIRTEWRKVLCNITTDEGESIVIIDLARYFGVPIEGWSQTEYVDSEGRIHKMFVYNYRDEDGFDPTMQIILPSEATEIKCEGDIITFSIPLTTDELVIKSPFIILIGVIAIDIIAIVSRRVKR